MKRLLDWWSGRRPAPIAPGNDVSENWPVDIDAAAAFLSRPEAEQLAHPEDLAAALGIIDPKLRKKL